MRLIACLLLLMGVSTGSAMAQTIGDNTAQETALQQLPIVDASGQHLDLRNHPGQVLIVDFWAHWCPSCIVEMSGYEKLQRDMGADKLKIVLVSSQRDWQQDQEYAVAHNIPFKLYVAGTASSDVVARALKGQIVEGGQVSMTLPMAAIFLPDGHLLGSAVGARDWGSKELEDNLRGVSQMKTGASP